MDDMFGVLYAAAFLDLCGVSMITMQLPNYLRGLGASHTTVGYIGSLYGFVQLFSSPLIGGYADTHSKKTMLMVCIATCAVGYMLLGASTSLWTIALLRIYLGVFKHPLNLIKSALADRTASSSSIVQSQTQGYYQSACSLAFIVAPPIAGYLMQTDNGYLIIGLLVALAYSLNAGLIWTFLPANDYSCTSDDIPVNKSDAKSKDNTSRSVWSFLSMSNVNQTSLLLLLFCCFLQSYSAMIWRNSNSILLKEVFHLTPPQIGWLISFNGCIQASIGALGKYISMIIPKSIHQLVFSCVLYACVMLTIANTSTRAYIYIAIVPLSLSSIIGKISYQGFVNETVGKGHTAYLIGITGSINSFSRLTAPVTVGYLMDMFSTTFSLYCSAACMLLAASLFLVIQYRESRNKMKPD